MPRVRLKCVAVELLSGMFEPSEQGVAKDQRTVLACTATGGVVRKMVLSLPGWFGVTAQAGDVLALDTVGFIHASGGAAPVHDTVAVKWFRKLAELKTAIAQ